MRSKNKTLEHTLAILGGLLLSISAFLHFESSTDFANDSQDKFIETYTIGLSEPLWYLIVVSAAVIFSIGYFTRGIVFRILVYKFTVLLSIFIFFITLLTGVTWGATPFIPQKEIGFEIAIAGYIVIITATIISMHKNQKMAPEAPSDLLDQHED
ncbi:hypothetical protein [Fluviicola sp.]|uniref:hypothetical protein n=1 Tax=Fluviicola sp. TaxID=1917219 RepID=UPI0031D3E56D